MLITVWTWALTALKIFFGVGSLFGIIHVYNEFKNEDTTGFDALVLFTIIVLSWPVVVYEVVKDEAKLWWHEHINYGQNWR